MTPDSRDLQLARAAGGKTLTEFPRKLRYAGLIDTHWWDEHTDLWIPKGVLLFRPWRMQPKPGPERDTMQLEG